MPNNEMLAALRRRRLGELDRPPEPAPGDPGPDDQNPEASLDERVGKLEAQMAELLKTESGEDDGAPNGAADVTDSGVEA